MNPQAAQTLRNLSERLVISSPVLSEGKFRAILQLNDGRYAHRRIDLIAPHTRWVRSFSCTEGHEAIARLARTKGQRGSRIGVLATVATIASARAHSGSAATQPVS